MPDAVIHTAAISDANFCQTNRSLSYAINVEATKNLAGICSDYHIPFAFTSTDLVFDGKRGMYKEYNEKNPTDQLTDDEIIDEFMTFFFAGMDTTAHTINMAFYHLVQEPNAMKAVRNELL